MAKFELVRSRQIRRQPGHIEIWGLLGRLLLTEVLIGAKRPFMLRDGGQLMGRGTQVGVKQPLRKSVTRNIDL